MSAIYPVVFKTLIVFTTTLLSFCFGNNHIQNSNTLLAEWNRNFESQITRIGGRLDQLMVRIDHLDSRVGRVQSLVQMRFDNIENGLTTTKLRMDLWGDELNRIEEQLTRKWKNLESKVDTLVGNIDSKLELKLNSIQRDNRRHNEFISSSFSTVVFGQDQLHDQMSSSNMAINTTLAEMKNVLFTSTANTSPPPPSTGSSNEKVLDILQELVANTTGSNQWLFNHHSHQNQSQAQYQLLSNKVTNMFDDLLKRSSSIEVSLKDSVSITNATRRDIQDGFRSIAVANEHNYRNNAKFPGSSTSSVGALSASSEMLSVIVEALASVESMSTALGRRMSELSRSIEERFEMVSMTLNGFLESCLRIQDGAPLIEEHIADVLEKILDAVDNSTRTATQIWINIAATLLNDRTNVSNHVMCSRGILDVSSELKSPLAHQQQQIHAQLVDEENETDGMEFEKSAVPLRMMQKRPTATPRNFDITRELILNGSGDLTEEGKKSLWESLFPNVPE